MCQLYRICLDWRDSIAAAINILLQSKHSSKIKLGDRLSNHTEVNMSICYQEVLMSLISMKQEPEMIEYVWNK